ncbi:MAG: hypothetical protein KI790_13955 [Cyclobacteriaceae bacterium]|nr:hypothetical protein [Cyclobacteriaceae bacterium HetDA_MAG_MS6]
MKIQNAFGLLIVFVSSHISIKAQDITGPIEVEVNQNYTFQIACNTQCRNATGGIWNTFSANVISTWTDANYHYVELNWSTIGPKTIEYYGSSISNTIDNFSLVAINSSLDWEAHNGYFIYNGMGIGLGTNNPKGDMELYGSTQRMIFSNAATNQERSARIEFWETASGGFSGAHFALQYDGTKDALRFKGKNGSNLDQDLMIVKRNGQVGIGTTSPDAKLTVKGEIHCEEITVDLNIPGPDYVFEDDYDLRPLEEVKAFIKANHHLPEVPSAQEMQTQGVNLVEMNMLLLKKVEELTLHQIELLERINELEIEAKKK